MPWRAREHWGSFPAWSFKRIREETAPVPQTALLCNPQPSQKLPEFSIASLNSHPILPDKCEPVTLAPALPPRWGFATLDRGATLSVQVCSIR